MDALFERVSRGLVGCAVHSLLGQMSSALLIESINMAGTNRRDFLRRASLGAVGVGAAVAVPEMLFGGAAQAAPLPPAAKPVDGPIVLLLRDPGSGEFTVMHGEQSSTFTDRALAARVTHEAPSA